MFYFFPHTIHHRERSSFKDDFWSIFSTSNDLQISGACRCQCWRALHTAYRHSSHRRTYPHSEPAIWFLMKFCWGTTFFDGPFLDFERSWKKGPSVNKLVVLTGPPSKLLFCARQKLGRSERVDVGTPPKNNMEPLYEGAFSASMLVVQGVYRSKCFQDPQNPAKGFLILFSCRFYQGFGGTIQLLSTVLVWSQNITCGFPLKSYDLFIMSLLNDMTYRSAWQDVSCFAHTGKIIWKHLAHWNVMERIGISCIKYRLIKSPVYLWKMCALSIHWLIFSSPRLLAAEHDSRRCALEAAASSLQCRKGLQKPRTVLTCHQLQNSWFLQWRSTSCDTIPFCIRGVAILIYMFSIYFREIFDFRCNSLLQLIEAAVEKVATRQRVSLRLDRRPLSQILAIARLKKN